MEDLNDKVETEKKEKAPTEDSAEPPIEQPVEQETETEEKPEAGIEDESDTPGKTYGSVL